MGSEKFQHRIARVWLKKPLPIEEILERLSVEPLLRGSANFTGIRGHTKLLVRIRWGTAQAARKLDIYCDSNADKELQGVIQQTLPVFTQEDFAVDGKAILEKQREEDESEQWERAKYPLMRVMLDLCENPIFIKERDRRITKVIGFPAFCAWVASGRDSANHVGDLSRKISGEIMRELADAMENYPQFDNQFLF